MLWKPFRVVNATNSFQSKDGKFPHQFQVKRSWHFLVELALSDHVLVTISLNTKPFPLEWLYNKVERSFMGTCGHNQLIEKQIKFMFSLSAG